MKLLVNDMAIEYDLLNKVSVKSPSMRRVIINYRFEYALVDSASVEGFNIKKVEKKQG